MIRGRSSDSALAAVIVLGFILTACTPTNWESFGSSSPSSEAGPSSGNTPAAGSTPTNPATGSGCNLNSSGNLKVLIVVDTSGSNVEASMDEGTVNCSNQPGVTCAPPTDPLKAFQRLNHVPI